VEDIIAALKVFFPIIDMCLIPILPSHRGWKVESTRHCRNGEQPVPKAVHRNGCCDKPFYHPTEGGRHNWPRPLTPQLIMPSLNHCDLLRHVGVNNLPKVVTRQRCSWELNSKPSSCKSNALTTGLPSHPYITGRHTDNPAGCHSNPD